MLSLTGRNCSFVEVTRFEQSRRRFLEDKRLLLHEIQSAGSVANKIKNAEYAVAVEEAHFVTKLRCIIKQLPESQGVVGQFCETPKTERPNNTATGTSATLQTFYETTGDVNIAEERLLEHEVSYTQELRRRGIARSQQRPLSVDTNDFEQSYKSKRQEIERGLEEAENRVGTARDMCLAEGIETELHGGDREPLLSLPSHGEDDPPGEKTPSVQHDQVHAHVCCEQGHRNDVSEMQSANINEPPTDGYQLRPRHRFRRLERIADSFWANIVRRFWDETRSTET